MEFASVAIYYLHIVINNYWSNQLFKIYICSSGLFLFVSYQLIDSHTDLSQLIIFINI